MTRSTDRIPREEVPASGGRPVLGREHRCTLCLGSRDAGGLEHPLLVRDLLHNSKMVMQPGLEEHRLVLEPHPPAPRHESSITHVNTPLRYS